MTCLFLQYTNLNAWKLAKTISSLSLDVSLDAHYTLHIWDSPEESHPDLEQKKHKHIHNLRLLINVDTIFLTRGLQIYIIKNYSISTIGQLSQIQTGAHLTNHRPSSTTNIRCYIHLPEGYHEVTHKARDMAYEETLF